MLRRVGRMSRMPSELGSMLEPGERGKENHARVNNHHQDTQRFRGEEQFEPRTNWVVWEEAHSSYLPEELRHHSPSAPGRTWREEG